MAEWYYTANKQQMGPVSLAELRQLASKGLLQPSDLVWREGMGDWARASSQGLFADNVGSARSARRLDEAEDDYPRRGSASRDDDDDVDDLDDVGLQRRAYRDGGMPVGVKVGLIVGGVVVVLVIVGVTLFFLLRVSGVRGPLVAGVGNFNGVLGPNDPRDTKMGNACRVYNVNMIQGRTYVIDLRTGQFDAFLRLEDSGFRELAEDDDGGGGRNSRIIFRCPRTDNYRVIATSLDNRIGAYSVSIRQN